jgi:hypothetical protein|tara:strand:- start:1064 stop:1291 length:228 start_codon:yes stop_codon:yes gene_type:complete
MKKREILKDIEKLWFVRTRFGEMYTEASIDPIDYEKIMDADITAMVKEVLAIEKNQLAETIEEIANLQAFLDKYQ